MAIGRNGTKQVVEGPVPMPEMPMMNVAGQVAMKEAVEDPVWRESRQLREEAERALKRLLVHEATVGHGWRLSSVADAIKALHQY